MKKIVGILTVAALATSLFAEVNVGAWGRSGMDFTAVSAERDPVTEVTFTEDGKTVVKNSTTGKKDGEQDGTVKTGMGDVTATPGWAAGSRVGVNFGAADADGNIGFNLNVDSNGCSIGVGDQAKVWANVGPVKVQFGRIQLDDLRGSIGDWGNREAFSVAGEDSIFTRFNPTGMTISATPVEGLFIGASINAGNSILDTLKSAQAGVGYTIADIAQIKAQYIGGQKTVTHKDTTKKSVTPATKEIALNKEKTEVIIKDVAEKVVYASKEEVLPYYGKIQAGVDILCLPMLVEIGVSVPLAQKTIFDSNVYVDDKEVNAVTLQRAVDSTIGFSGSADAFSYKGHVIFNFADTSSNAMLNLTMGCDFACEYDLGVVALGANAGYKYAPSFAKDSEGNITSFTDIDVSNGFGGELYAKKAFGNGYFFGGVAGTCDITKDASLAKTVTTYNVKIPVGAEYWF